MTTIPCCTWYLSSTWKNITVTNKKYTHILIYSTHTNLCRAVSVLLGYICYNQVLQELAWISVSFEPKTGKIKIKHSIFNIVHSTLYFAHPTSSKNLFVDHIRLTKRINPKA